MIIAGWTIFLECFSHRYSSFFSSKQHHKSKFHFFQKKAKSRDPSPISTNRASARDKDTTLGDGFIAAPPDVVPTSSRPHPMLSKGVSEASYGSDSIDLTNHDLQVCEFT